MSKYIEIIQAALQSAYDTQSFNEPINEQTTIKMIAIVDVAMEYFADNNKKVFYEIMNVIRKESIINDDIISMAKKLREIVVIDDTNRRGNPPGIYDGF